MIVLALAFAAGSLSILSPCVLPLVPLVLGTAVAQHRLGPLALAAGLAVSFTALGLIIAVAGFALGLDANTFRYTAAVIMMMVGMLLLLPSWQVRLATIGGPVSGWADRSFGGFNSAGLGGQFAMGVLLGAVWTPCVGPTLGAASVLAAQGQDLTQVATTMLAFGIGAALPLAALGLLSRAAISSLRDKMLSAGQLGKSVLGIMLLVIGFGIVSGFDKRIEALLVDVSPAWLTELTTRF